MGEGAALAFLVGERLSQALAASLLEEVCGRAALLAGDVEGYASAGVGLGPDGGMADDSGEDEGRSEEGEVTVAGGCDNGWIGGAVLRDRREVDPGVGGGIGRMHRSGAVMCAVPSAAGGQICIGVGGEGQQRRDQRKAEEEKQREAEYTSHSVIVTMFVIDVPGRGYFSLVSDWNSGWLMLVAMTPIEVEVIDDTQCHGRGVDGARCRDRRVPVLKLHIPFDRQIMGQVVVQSDAGGVHNGVGLDVEGVAVDEPGGKVVDLAAADEEVGVGVELS